MSGIEPKRGAALPAARAQCPEGQIRSIWNGPGRPAASIARSARVETGAVGPRPGTVWGTTAIAAAVAAGFCTASMVTAVVTSAKDWIGRGAESTTHNHINTIGERTRQ